MSQYFCKGKTDVETVCCDDFRYVSFLLINAIST